VIEAIDGLREYLDHPYRRLLSLFQEMHGIVTKPDLAGTNDLISPLCVRANST
jgi:hypothetical protein